MHSPMSITRMMTISTQPPNQPATEPTNIPIRKGRIAPIKPTASDTRAPTQTRVHRSRPAESVPNQCSALGE